MFLLKVITILSMMSMMSNTPIMMTMTILSLSSSMMFLKWMETSNPWMPLIFTLAFLGGMMIIFMYIISITPTQPKKTKNKQPMLFVFVSLSLWTLKYGSNSSMVCTILSSSMAQYFLLCFLISLILIITTKVINSPFKALKGAN